MYIPTKQINEYGDVTYTTKNATGQHVQLEFDKYTGMNGSVWYVRLWIGKRKKGYQYLKQTNKDGLQSLLWVKRQIKTFIDELSSRENHTIVVQWDDNRRRDLYTRGLKDLGFYMSIMDTKKSLLLKVNKK